MNEVVKVLMSRDDLTKEEAQSRVSYVKELVSDAVASGDYDEVENIIASELGLEMDYIFDIL